MGRFEREASFANWPTHLSLAMIARKSRISPSTLRSSRTLWSGLFSNGPTKVLKVPEGDFLPTTHRAAARPADSDDARPGRRVQGDIAVAAATAVLANPLKVGFHHVVASGQALVPIVYASAPGPLIAVTTVAANLRV